MSTHPELINCGENKEMGIGRERRKRPDYFSIVRWQLNKILSFKPKIVMSMNTTRKTSLRKETPQVPQTSSSERLGTTRAIHNLTEKQPVHTANIQNSLQLNSLSS